MQPEKNKKMEIINMVIIADLQHLNKAVDKKPIFLLCLDFLWELFASRLNMISLLPTIIN
jgi:hypothetical protein